jgi:bifunctional UDP-N-acetylglucosamine pyrophosphorylase/glucosamine-1-phosphate N-acetyltransferase
MLDVVAIVLAAGKGTRMKSNLPKVMHKVGGKYLVQHVLDAVSSAGISRKILVVGSGAEYVQTSLGDNYRYAVQADQLGTGHAVLQAGNELLPEENTVLVVCGDMPLLSAPSLIKLIERHGNTGAKATVLTAYLGDPTGYGRIIRDEQGKLQRIIEEKDATAEAKKIQEINTGTYCFDRNLLFSALKEIQPNNTQGEYYLTDVLTIMINKGLKVEVVDEAEDKEAFGINSRQQLAAAENILRQRKLDQLMTDGVTVIDPKSTFVDAAVEIAPDTILYPFTFIEGRTSIGSGSQVGPMTRIVDSILGNEVVVQNSVILESFVGDNCNIGPFAYLRPETHLGRGVKVGDFVELKKSKIGDGSKIPHLSYVGDAIVGSDVNIGCGTITCNYDGINKHQTIIEDGAFIGSNSNLVAPIKIGANATTGAGSTITKDVPENSLAVERSKQKVISNWTQKRSTF